jgi:hypothetical protein
MRTKRKGTGKAIETEYKGRLFRSRTEARHAIFLDCMNEPWEYEKEGYDLPSGRYLPDFWLPRLDCWLEIKGAEPTEKEKTFCEELFQATCKGVAISWGEPKQPDFSKPIVGLEFYCHDCTDGSGGTQWWDECFWAHDEDDRLCIGSNDDHGSREFYVGAGLACPAIKLDQDVKHPVQEVGFKQMRKARFEYGQTPKVIPR